MSANAGRVTSLLLPWLVFLPLLTAFIILLMPKERVSEIRRLAVLTTFLTLLLSIHVCLQYDSAAAGYQFQTRFLWLPALGISYHTGVDGIGCLMILLHALCSFSAVLVSFSIRERVKEYFIFFLILIASIFGVFTSIDLFLLYLFYEMAVIPMYPLIAIWGSRNKDYAAMKLTLYITTGAVLAFVGLLALYHTIGIKTFDLIEIRQYLHLHPLPAYFQLWCTPLFIIGFGIIASLWPFHSWSPIGYAAAPTPVSMLHAGVLKKIGIYVLIRLVAGLMPLGAAKWFPYVAILAVINVLYGAWAAMAQKDMKFIIGFASVSHMGYALLGLAANNELALTGVVFFLFAHGVMAALSFALIGFLYDQAHTRMIGDFGGLSKSLPFISVCFVMAALASSGLPGFANFASEIVIFFGSWDAYRLETILAVFGIVITAAYMLRFIRLVFFGAANPRWTALKDATTLFQKLPYGLLLIVLILFGIWPSFLIHLIRPSVSVIAL